MTEKTFAQKAIENCIVQKQRVANKNFQDYSEHTDYTEFHDAKYFDYGDYVDCHGDYYDFDYGIPSGVPKIDDCVEKPKKTNIFQRIFGRGSR